jgi:hypothetical protein
MNKTIAVATIIISLFSCSQKKQGEWKNIFPEEKWLISDPIDQGIEKADARISPRKSY